MIELVLFILLLPKFNSLQLQCEIIKSFNENEFICMDFSLNTANDSTEIDSVRHNFRNKITSLHLMSDKMLFLPLKLFDHFPRVKELKIYTDIPQIDSLLPEHFSKANKLNQIFITNQRIKRLQSNTFSSLVELTRLILPANQIEIIDHDAFKGLNNCKMLDLHSNLLKEIDWNIIDSLPKLSDLNLENNKLIVTENELLKKAKLKALLNGNTCSTLHVNTCEIFSKCHVKCESENYFSNQAGRRSFFEPSPPSFGKKILDEATGDTENSQNSKYSQFTSSLLTSNKSLIPKEVEDIPRICSDYKKSTNQVCKTFQFSFNYFKTCGPTYIIESSCDRYLNNLSHKKQIDLLDYPYTYNEIMAATSDNYFFAEYCMRAQESKKRCNHNRLDSEFCADLLIIISHCLKVFIILTY